MISLSSERPFSSFFEQYLHGSFVKPPALSVQCVCKESPPPHSRPGQEQNSRTVGTLVKHVVVSAASAQVGLVRSLHRHPGPTYIQLPHQRKSNMPLYQSRTVCRVAKLLFPGPERSTSLTVPTSLELIRASRGMREGKMRSGNVQIVSSLKTCRQAWPGISRDNHTSTSI